VHCVKNSLTKSHFIENAAKRCRARFASPYKW
jgi:hypothetical protein